MTEDRAPELTPDEKAEVARRTRREAVHDLLDHLNEDQP